MSSLSKPDYQRALELVEELRLILTKMHIPSPDGNPGSESSVYLMHYQLWASVRAAIMAHRDWVERTTAQALTQAQQALRSGPKNREQRRQAGRAR